MQSFIRYGVLGYLLILAVAQIAISQSAFAQTNRSYVAIYRDNDAWLLRAGGDGVDKQSGSSAPVPTVKFCDLAGKPYQWRREPMAFTAFGEHWLLVDGSTSIYRFSRNGKFVDVISAPIMVTDIVSSTGHVWIYSALPNGGLAVADRRLKFRSTTARTIRSGLSRVQSGIDAVLVVAPASDGAFLYSHLIGPPVLYRVALDSKVSEYALAYRRTALRNERTAADPSIMDQRAFSSPTRDILSLTTDRMLVLRNLEDEPLHNGGTGEFAGRRADLYDMPSGAHVGTATFPEPMRWLLRTSGDSLIAFSRSGRILEARIGRPVRGSIVK